MLTGPLESRMENFNETELTPEEPVPREMRPRRAVFLMIATLLLWCGSMLLFLDLAANASGTHGQVALIGLVLVAIGGSCLWADFFEVTASLPVNVGYGPCPPPGYTRLSYPRSFTREANLWSENSQAGMQMKATSKRN